MKNKVIIIAAVIITTAFAFTSCRKEVPQTTLSDSKEVPSLPETPYDYPASDNDYLAALGRVLFYEKELSSNKNISCGTCHKQSSAFTDNLRVSPGTDNIAGDRNTPSLFARNGRLFWDGRAHSFPDLALRPIRNSVEMNVQDISHLLDRIASIDYYSHLFPHAFPNMNKPGGAKYIDSNSVKIALAEFLKNFNFSNTKFDRHQNNGEALTQSEQIGKDLFFGHARCSQCHHIESNGFNGNSGYGFVDESHNIGLDETNKDLGVGAVTKNASDEGAFMMPVLLNIQYTAPYMHDGRFATLEEVVDHYDKGIKNNPNLDFRLKDHNNSSSAPVKLNLTEGQKKGLVDFLKTLSDPSVLTDPKFSDPFVPRVQ